MDNKSTHYIHIHIQIYIATSHFNMDNKSTHYIHIHIQIYIATYLYINTYIHTYYMHAFNYNYNAILRLHTTSNLSTTVFP